MQPRKNNVPAATYVLLGHLASGQRAQNSKQGAVHGRSHSSRACSRDITDDRWLFGAAAALGGAECADMFDCSALALRHTGATRSGRDERPEVQVRAVVPGTPARFAIALVLTVMPPMQDDVDVLCSSRARTGLGPATAKRQWTLWLRDVEK